jgi:hypothetical protein
MSMIPSSSQFWFVFPSDMRGTSYSVIVELFGSWMSVGYGIYDTNGLSLLRDAYYGLLPQNVIVCGGIGTSPLLAFTRQSFNAPAPEITLLISLSYAGIAAIFVGAMSEVLYDRRKRIGNFLRDNTSSILFFWISVILFVVMIVLIVAFK